MLLPSPLFFNRKEQTVLTELSVTIVRAGSHLEIRQDGLMVAKAIQNILNNGEIEDFYDNWVYPLDPEMRRKKSERSSWD